MSSRSGLIEMQPNGTEYIDATMSFKRRIVVPL
jgi:hypothetical protein